MVNSSYVSSRNGIDRISGLPDPLISYILSFLPTKNAVATNVLSTRWKFLWTSITKLDFYCECQDYSHLRIPEMEKRVKMKRKGFNLFVKRVLLLLKPPYIHKLRLRLCGPYCFNFACLNSWISAGFGRTVGEFSLVLRSDIANPQLNISQICCNVVVLNLFGNISLDIPATASTCFLSVKDLHLYLVTCDIANNSSIIFPKLKTMRLDCVKFKNEGSVYNLFSSSPLLEDLFIQDATYYGIEGIIIHIPSLTRLSIHTSSYEYESMCKLKINAPALQYLDLDCLLTHECLVVENLPSLIQADVRMFFCDKNDVNVESCIGIVKFLGRVSKVKFLYLTCDIKTEFRIVSTNIVSDSHDLMLLKMKLPKCLDLSMMTSSFLESMDNLEHLVLKPFNKWDRQFWWVEPLNVPMCLLSQLATITITDVLADCCGLLELLRYFLKNAKALQMLTISAKRLSEKQQFVLLKKISLMPRASHKCQVAFT